MIVRIELSLEFPLGIPRVGAFALHHVHAVVNGRAVVLTPHLHLRRRRIVARISREDGVPVTIDLMNLGCPQIGRVVHAWWRLEDKLGLGIVPVGQYVATVNSYIKIVGVSKIVVAIVAEDPAVAVRLK